MTKTGLSQSLGSFLFVLGIALGYTFTSPGATRLEVSVTGLDEANQFIAVYELREGLIQYALTSPAAFIAADESGRDVRNVRLWWIELVLKGDFDHLAERTGKCVTYEDWAYKGGLSLSEIYDLLAGLD